MELLLRVLKWSLLAGAVTALVALTKPLLDRRFTPRWRYWLWLVLAAALLLSPLPWVDLVPDLPEPAVTVTAPEVRVPVSRPTRPAPEASGTPVTQPEPVTPVDPVTPDDPVTSGDPVTPEIPATPEPPRAGTAERRTVELSALLTAVWLLGAVVFALWHILGTALLVSRLRRWSVPAGGGAVSLCRELSKELGLRRAPQVGVSRGLASPLVAGLFRPRLWLPDRAWEERELEFILRHELTHLKRRDLWYKALMLAANALHWFDPLIWLLRREAGETAELLCDAQALSGADRETRRAYCEALLEHICRVPGAALTTHFYGGKHSVKTRFQNLLSGRKRRFGWTAFACCVLAVAVTACAVGVAASDSVKPEDFDGKFTASLYKYVSLRDENGERIQDKAVLVSSPDELDALRRSSGIEPIDDGFRVVNGELAEKLDGYDRDYFRENVLVVLIREMGSGSFELAVEGVALDGDALAVTLSEYNPNTPDATMDLCQWCVLVECRRVEGVASVRWDVLPETDGDEKIVTERLTGYFTNFTRETLLYTDEDLTVFTVLDERFDVPDRSYPLPDGPQGLEMLSKNISFYQEKAAYFKGHGIMTETYPENLELTFAFEDLEIGRDTARVEVHVGAGFNYRGLTQPTFSESVYVVDLINASGEWLIADINERWETFDAVYKDADFSAAAALSREAAGVPPVPDDYLPTTLAGKELLESPSGVVMKVTWHGDVTVYPVTDEYDLRRILSALTGLRLPRSDAAALPEDEMTILFETGDGSRGVALGKSYGPLELTGAGVPSFYELTEARHEELLAEFYRIAQGVADDALFAGITADGSLTMEEAAAAISERMAENVRALPGWVEWKPVDARSLGAGVFDAYLGEPQNFCAGVGIALKFSTDSPEDPCRSYWETGSGLPEEPIDGGELDGYYEWGRGMDVLRNPDGDWELAGVYTGGGGVDIPGWSYSSGVENSFDLATAEDLLRLYTLTEGEFHRFVASRLNAMTPEELQDLPALLPLLTKAQAQELHGLVADVSDGTAPARALLFEALEDYIEQ